MQNAHKELDLQIRELIPRLEGLATAFYSKNGKFEMDYIFWTAAVYIGGGCLEFRALEPGLYVYEDDPCDGYAINHSEKISIENVDRLIEFLLNRKMCFSADADLKIIKESFISRANSVLGGGVVRFIKKHGQPGQVTFEAWRKVNPFRNSYPEEYLGYARKFLDEVRAMELYSREWWGHQNLVEELIRRTIHPSKVCENACLPDHEWATVEDIRQISKLIFEGFKQNRTIEIGGKEVAKLN